MVDSSSTAVVRWRRGFAGAAALLLPSVAILAALWLPFGFSMTGLIEEWDLLGLFTIYGPFAIARFDGPLAPHAMRPLMPLSFVAAYLIDRDSFAGWHFLTLAALLVKGGAMTYLVARATRSRALGVIGGVLLLLYPADTMQLSFRSIHINTALALVLGGCALLMKAFEMDRPVRATLAAAAGALLYLVAICIYELSLTLIALPLALCFVRHGREIFRRPRQWRLGLFWLGAAGLFAAYVVWVAPKIASYQGQVTGDRQAVLAAAYGALPKLFTVGAARALVGGWIDALRMVGTEYASHVYLACASCVVALVIALVARIGRREGGEFPGDVRASRGVPLRLLLAGLMLMLLGYAPFLTSPAHLAISQRTFLWATPGAVLAWVALLLALWRLARAPAMVAMLGLLVLGLGAQLFQFHHYVNISERQRSMLRAIVEQVDSVTPNKTLLLLDGTSQVGHTWFFLNDGLHNALSYLYGQNFGPIELCRTPSMEWQRPDALGRKGRCDQDDAGWTLSGAPSVRGPGVAPTAPGPARRLATNEVTVVTVREDGGPADAPGVVERRRRLETGKGVIERRYRGMLASRPHGVVGPMFRDEFVGDRYRWSFGDWWSLDLAPRGAGWGEVEWVGDGIRQRSSARKTSRMADLQFDLAPAAGSYILRAQFDRFGQDAIRDSLRLQLNGRPVNIQWMSHFQFQAEVPPGVLTNGVNRLAFDSDVEESFFGLSAWMDWVELEPGRLPN
jgi:hypothetical protein